MPSLAAFADEISPDLGQQINACRENGISQIELRSVDKINVLDFDKNLRSQVRSRLADAGLKVAVIASPIGKVKIDEPWGPHLDRFKIAVELAGFFGAPFIRLFSYYAPASGTPIAEHRDQVLRRFQEKVDLVRDLPIILLHENEKHIYGDTGGRCLDLLRTIDSPKLRLAFDFANFVQVGERPRENWELLKSYVVHIHVKDALLAGGAVVPAGQGDGDVELILGKAWAGGYRGLLSLEPHLAAAGEFSGFSGPALFKTAVDALKQILRRQKIPIEKPSMGS
jgi:sugar phosphate isomerase/epimerase